MNACLGPFIEQKGFPRLVRQPRFCCLLQPATIWDNFGTTPAQARVSAVPTAQICATCAANRRSI